MVPLSQTPNAEIDVKETEKWRDDIMVGIGTEGPFCSKWLYHGTWAPNVFRT